MIQGDSRAIGVFDSGIGGLTVVKALYERLPLEKIIYFGDTARVPYGMKSVETIKQFTAQIAQILLAKNVKMLIIACNTISAVASDVVHQLAKAHNVPVLDVIEAGVESVVSQGTERIGVIGTSTTINSEVYAKRIYTLNTHVRVFSYACPLFVPLVEEGWLNHAVTRMIAEEYLRPVLAENVDSLLLACTHYPLLKPLLKELLGNKLRLIDSAQTVANMAAITLKQLNLENLNTENQISEFIVTDVPLRFQALAERFLGRNLSNLTQLQWADR